MNDLIVDFPQRRSLSTSSHDSTLLPPPLPSPSRRRVTFSPHLEIKVIENLAIEHASDLWFTRREVKDFKLQTSMLLQAILSNHMTVAQFAEMNAQDTSVFVGLENYLSRATSEKIRERRRAIQHGVLEEQKRQLEAGICDHEAISVASKRVSDTARQRAHIIGLLHAEPSLSGSTGFCC